MMFSASTVLPFEFPVPYIVRKTVQINTVLHNVKFTRAWVYGDSTAVVPLPGFGLQCRLLGVMFHVNGSFSERSFCSCGDIQDF